MKVRFGINDEFVVTNGPTDSDTFNTSKQDPDQSLGTASPVGSNANSTGTENNDKPPKKYLKSGFSGTSKNPKRGSKPNTGVTTFASSMSKAANLESVKELQGLVGLENVKSLMEEIVAYVTIERRREQEGLITEPMVLHMIFKGNPGTGKTTVARLMGKLLKELGVLEKGHLIEVERADLVGEYVGHTAHRTREQLRKGIGGVLFIDEAYSLARGGTRDFGREAIDTLVKSMEEHRKELVIILAGYRDEMDDFLASNPGLRSRFPIHLSFEDYSEEELFDIVKLMIEERQYRLTEAAEGKLMYVISNSSQTGHPFGGNARFVRNLAEKAIRQQALRLVNYDSLTREQLILLEACDIPEETNRIEGTEKVSNLELLNSVRSGTGFAASEG